MKFEIPQLGDTNEWQIAVDQSEGTLQFLLLAQGRIVSASQFLQNVEVTSEKLGWLILWSRTFQAIEDGKALLQSKSTFATELLERSLGDSIRSLCIIIEPLGWSGQSKDKIVQEVHYGLKDYAAWCLWNDVQVNERTLNRKNMDEAYDPEPVISALNSEFYQKLFPEDIKIETNSEEIYRQRRNNEELLFYWNEKILCLIKQLNLQEQWDHLEEAKSNKKWVKSFSEFLDNTRTSVKKEMRKQGIEFAYSVYQKSSNIAHGSSATHFVHLGEEKIAPYLTYFEDIVHEQVAEVARSANFIATMLLFIAQYSNWDKVDEL